MEQDHNSDSTRSDRPLPKWLTDQRDGLNTVQHASFKIKEDKSLGISFALTGLIIFIVITILTIYILRRKKKQSV